MFYWHKSTSCLHDEVDFLPGSVCCLSKVWSISLSEMTSHPWQDISTLPTCFAPTLDHPFHIHFGKSPKSCRLLKLGFSSSSGGSWSLPVSTACSAGWCNRNACYRWLLVDRLTMAGYKMFTYIATIHDRAWQSSTITWWSNDDCSCHTGRVQMFLLCFDQVKVEFYEESPFELERLFHPFMYCLVSKGRSEAMRAWIAMRLRF